MSTATLERLCLVLWTTVVVAARAVVVSVVQ